MNPTLYDILGVSPDASRDEIRQAWREAADRFEPGEGGSTKQFRLFNEAAEVLLDPERRKEYDAGLAGADAVPATPGRNGVSLRKEEPAAEGAGDEAAGDEPAGDEPAGDEPAGDEGVDAAAALATPVPGPPVPGAAAALTGEASTGGPDAPTTSAAPGEDQAPEDQAPEDQAPEDQAPGEGQAPREKTRWDRPLPWQVFAVLGVVTAVAVGFAAYFLVQAQRAEDYQEALDRAPAAAENAAAAVLSYDYKSLEADRDAAAKFLTDDYRSQYVDTFDKLVQENATDTKATVKAQVLASSAMVVGEKRDPHKVSVLLFVNQSTVSAATTGQPTVALNRVRFDMVEQDGTWLVGGITSY